MCPSGNDAFYIAQVAGLTATTCSTCRPGGLFPECCYRFLSKDYCVLTPPP